MWRVTQMRILSDRQRFGNLALCRGEWLTTSCEVRLGDGWAARVPVCVALEERGGGDNGTFVSDPGNELNSNREFLGGEAAGHTDRGKSTEIADAAERVGKGEVSFEICFERGGRYWERGGDQNIELIE
jgi:hypothetical protein